jgi:hypothetical protein
VSELVERQLGTDLRTARQVLEIGCSVAKGVAVVEPRTQGFGRGWAPGQVIVLDRRRSVLDVQVVGSVAHCYRTLHQAIAIN